MPYNFITQTVTRYRLYRQDLLYLKATTYKIYIYCRDRLEHLYLLPISFKGGPLEAYKFYSLPL